MDQSASHRADKEVRAANKRTKRSKEFIKSLELARRYRLQMTYGDYRTEVNCRFICRCQNDEFVVTIAHKPSCVKSGDLCKYTKNGTQVCSRILWVIRNKLRLNEEDKRLMQVAYTTTKLKDMLSKVKENQLAPMYFNTSIKRY